ncbi:PAS domain S-box protein [Chitinimonas lacunae]|uniref:histidine kinase n=1 Tax=Chitinimonas lacunae TaxID=1963018 RepID=A0ABV8MSV5_9NEIS
MEQVRSAASVIVRRSAAWPVGGGEAGALIRERDWRHSPLGPVEDWPQSLRTSLDLLLPAEAQIVLFWGPEFIAFYNDSYAPTIGAKHPRAFGLPAALSWHELWADLEPLLDGVRRSGQTFSARDRPFRIDRYGFLETVYFDVSYSAVRNESGEVAGVLCIVNETTKRVRDAQALVTSEARLRAEQDFTRRVLDSTTEGFYSLDRDGCATFCNASFVRMLGYQWAEEVIGRRLHSEIRHSRADGTPYSEADSPICQVARSGYPVHCSGEYFFRRDGSCFPVDYRAEPIYRDGELQGVVCTFTDISDRLAREQALREAEQARKQAAERIELALNTGAVLGTWVWEVPHDRFISDERFARTFSLDAAALARGLPIGEVRQAIHPEDRLRVDRLVTEALRRGGSYRAEYRVRQEDGAWLWIEANGHVELDEQGRPLRFPGVLIDIHERKQAEAARQIDLSARLKAELALREMHDQLRMAQMAGGIGVFLLDIATNWLTVSPEFCRIFGLPVCESLATEAVESLSIEEDRSYVSNPISRRQGTAELQVEYRIRRHDDGALRWISRRAEFVRDASGRPLQMRGVVQDITERKAVEATLRQSEARFRVLAQAMPNQVWTTAPDGQLDWANDQFCDYTGLGLAELAGEGWHAIVHPDDLPGVLASWQQAVASGERYDSELRVRRRDGSYRWHIARALPIEGGDRLLRWIGTHTDIDDQKAAQAELARRNASLAQRVEARTRDRDRLWCLSTDLMVVARFDGAIVAVNPAWHGVLGWDGESLLDSSLLALVHEDDQALTAAAMRQLAQGGATLRFENRYRHRDGHFLMISWTAVPDANRIHAVGRDITAERAHAKALGEAEARLRQSQKMEALGQLTGGIAHDFNNLLQGITGALSLLRRRVSHGRLDDAERFIEMAAGSARRAAALTHRLLAFARRQPLDSKPVDVNRLVGSMEDLLHRTLGEHIALLVVLGDAVGPVLSDESQLENALLNLAINARDAMPDGGKLTIETANVTLPPESEHDGLRPGSYTVISVSDTGIGMTPEVLGRAFEPFFTTKPIGQGTGLGLSMIYGFVKQSGGHVRIASTPRCGTTIRLYLPHNLGATALPAPVESAQAPRGGGETVLVVEDDEAVRMLVVEVLHELGYSAIEVSDGNAAVPVLLSDQPIELLISDVGLPGLNGRQVAEIARRHRPALPILFMTGYAQHAAVRSEFLGPGMEMVMKPFAMDALAVRIRDILAAKRA